MKVLADRPALAEVLKQETRIDHERAETSSFMTRLMAGQLDLAAYVRYLEQYELVYAALEQHAAHPGGPAILEDTRLHRSAAIAHDLAALDAPGRHRGGPLVVSLAYAARIRDAGKHSVARFLAHHYTRYLGDLSGGQAIAALMKRHYGATDDQLTFFHFEGIGTPVHYKRHYREQLNALDLEAGQVQQLLDEVRRAFRFNAAIFAELERELG